MNAAEVTNASTEGELGLERHERVSKVRLEDMACSIQYSHIEALCKVRSQRKREGTHYIVHGGQHTQPQKKHSDLNTFQLVQLVKSLFGFADEGTSR